MNPMNSIDAVAILIAALNYLDTLGICQSLKALDLQAISFATLKIEDSDTLDTLSHRAARAVIRHRFHWLMHNSSFAMAEFESRQDKECYLGLICDIVRSYGGIYEAEATSTAPIGA